MARRAGILLLLGLLAASLAQPPKGRPVPTISLPTLDGKQLTLRAVYDKKRKTTVLSVTLRYRYKGKWVTKRLPAKAVLIDFWASWCGPCMAAMPHLASLHRKYAKRGLVVIGVNLGERHSTVQRVAKSLRIPYIILLDRGRATGKSFRLKYIPTLVLVNSKGIVVHTETGFMPDMERALESRIKSLLGLR